MSLLLLFLPQGAPVYDASSNPGYRAADATYSWSHTTTTQSNRILVVSVGLLSVVNSVTGITYGGAALTKLRHDVSASTTVRTEIWYLIAPATGINTVEVTLATGSVSGASATTYHNASPAQPDAQNGDTGVTGAGGGSASISVTTVTNNSVVIDAIATPDTVITVQSGQTQRANITGAVGSLGQSEAGPKTPAGAVTMQWNDIAGLTSWTMSGMSIKPFSVSDAVSPIVLLLLLGAG